MGFPGWITRPVWSAGQVHLGNWNFIEIFLKFRLDYQVGSMGQPGWMVRSPKGPGLCCSWASFPKTVPNLCTNL